MVHEIYECKLLQVVSQQELDEHFQTAMQPESAEEVRCTLENSGWADEDTQKGGNEEAHHKRWKYSWVIAQVTHK